MKPTKITNKACGSLVPVVLASMICMPSAVIAQNSQDPQMQERVAEIKVAIAYSKTELTHYTWQEDQTIAIKGTVKKEHLYQVEYGPDGKPQETEIDPQDQSSEGRQHGLKHRIKEKKTEEYEDYGKQVASLAQSYAKPDPDAIQRAYRQGNIMVGPTGAPNQMRLVIKNYLKPGDSVTFVFDRARKEVQGIQVASYLNDPKDAVTISAQFAQLPDGTNHVSHMIVNGVSKQLTVNDQNSNYQKI